MIHLAVAGLRHHARSWGWVVAAVALVTGLVASGLAMGEGLDVALAARVDRQLGPVVTAVRGRAAGFDAGLGPRLAAALDADVAVVTTRDAVLSTSDGGARGVTVHGVDASLDVLAGWAVAPPPGVVRVDADLGGRLGVVPGDRAVIRMARPSALGDDLALTAASDTLVGVSVEVGPWLDGRWPTDLALRVQPGAPDVALVDRAWLAEQLGVPDRATTVLTTAPAEAVAAALDEAWSLADGGLSLVTTADGVALRSDRVLLDPSWSDRVARLPGAEPASVWFIDSVGFGDRTSPYAFVAGVDPAGAGAVDAQLPDDLDADAIVLDAWLADDLGAGVGDEVTLKVPVLGAFREVTYTDASLRVAAVLPLVPDVADATWMPPIEGIADQQSCRSWDPGLPVDLSRIRDVDEAWWDAHGGAPKAWVRRDTAHRLWGSSHGDDTTVRWPGGTEDAVRAAVRGVLGPGDLGLRAEAVRDHLVAASAPANDFGMLFLGFQFVLVLSALVLASLQAGFALDVRARELGTLRAVGWPARRVAAVILSEAAGVVVVGVVLGIPLAWGMVVGLEAGLASAWSTATTGVSVPGLLTPSALAVAAGSAGVLTLATVGWRVRGALRRPPRDLLAGASPEVGTPKVRRAALVAGLALIGAVVLAVAGPAERTPDAALRFFASGGLALLAWWSGGYAVLARGRLGLGPTGVLRRPGRALALVGLLGCGTFLVVGVGLGGGRAPADATARTSGSGGFALWGEAVLPVPERLDGRDGADRWALRPALPEGSVVPLRVVAGDDASCLQLGSAQTPTLLGVPAGAFDGRFTTDDALWTALATRRDDGRIPALGDAATVTWGLHAAVGDVLTYAGARGEPVEVVLVGILPPSVAQGSLFVDADQLHARFPGADHRVFLVDVPSADADEVAQDLDRALADRGGRFVPTVERLEAFAAVEDTYVAIFRVLGGLGLVLGAVGVGLVLSRGVHERRGELAALRALGFARSRLVGWVVAEHAGAVALGLVGGAVAAALAVVPVVLSPEADPPVGEVAGLVLATAVVALVSLVLAARRGVAGPVARELARERV